MKKSIDKSVIILMALIMYLGGIGMLIWSAISINWLRLLIGIIFIIFSVGYAYAK